MPKNMMAAELAVRKEKREIYIDFSENELNLLKDDLVDKMTEFKRVDDEFSVIKEDYKDRLKFAKAEQDTVFKQIREGRKSSEEVLLYVPNFDDGNMEIYRECNGELYETRKLRPDERQMYFDFNQSVAN